MRDIDWLISCLAIFLFLHAYTHYIDPVIKNFSPNIKFLIQFIQYKSGFDV
jgi:hypothetical protein